jgi:hypothetical protein
MKTAIMQPYFLPQIGYFSMISAVNSFYIYEDVNFNSSVWVNRNTFLNAGRIFLATIPLEKKSHKLKINDLKIIKRQNWVNKITKSIQQSYSKALSFKYVFPFFQNIINYNTDNLSEYLTYQIKEICNFLNIKTKIYSSVIFNNSHLKGEDRVIDICIKSRTNTYINRYGGANYYKKDNFKKYNIELKFIKEDFLSYAQVNANKFNAPLSIIDLLMNVSRDQYYKHLFSYKIF